MKQLDDKDFLEALRAKLGNRAYTAMYSSWVGGIVTDPALMIVPIDDHLVHRGDGVFEALHYTDFKFFEWQAHSDRLYRSAEMIALEVPVSPDELRSICDEVARVGELSEGNLRIYVSRGPGDFSPNPYKSVGSQLYVVAMPPYPEKPDRYTDGATICFSKVPVKPFPYAQIKSCNYLQNVLTVKESIDRGFDFAINVTEDGKVAEGPTENLLVLTSDNRLVCPPFDYTLRGTTLLRVLQIAESLKSELNLSEVGQAELTAEDLRSAKEVMMVGTTLGVCPVVKVEGDAVGSGVVGPVAKVLYQKLSSLQSKPLPQKS